MGVDCCKGPVAQLGERRPCKAEVVGSIPIGSTGGTPLFVVLNGVETGFTG